jgi:curved DNA-binding protein CbpA
MSEKNYYKILAVEKTAEDEQIREAYKLVSKKYQADESDLLNYVYKMKELNEACLVLTDDDERAKYDNSHSSIESSQMAEPEDDESEQEIPIERDNYCEDEYKIKVENCTVYLSDKGQVNVIGEVVTQSGNAINKYKEIHFSIYDATGKLLGTGYANWSKFGRRQSFNRYVDFKPKSAIPAKVRVYPGE